MSTQSQEQTMLKLSNEAYVNFILNDDKKSVHVFESLDYYGHVDISREELKDVIDALTEIHKLMVES